MTSVVKLPELPRSLLTNSHLTKGVGQSSSRSVEVGRRVGVWYFPFEFDTSDAAEERKLFVRMFGARKACYKCGNGVSAPFYIIFVQANAVQLMELGTSRKLSPYHTPFWLLTGVAPIVPRKDFVSTARSRVCSRSWSAAASSLD